MFFTNNNFFMILFRNERDSELKEKIASISDLQSRLRVNVESVQQLSQQVNIIYIVYFYFFEYM